MSVFTVDADKCKKDGTCAKVCPTKVIEHKKGRLPAPNKFAEEMCINCGHCLAVCPHGALTLRDMPVDDCPPIDKELAIGPEAAEQFLRSRRSIRVYKDQPVDRETLEKLIRIARYAPTGHNFQPVEWLVVYEREEVKRLGGMVVDWMKWAIKEEPAIAAIMHLQNIVLAWRFGIDVVMRDAPHLIVAHGPKHNPASQSSCVIAQAYLELAAPPLGLGACWAGFFDGAVAQWKPLQEALDLPEGNASFGSMMVGYSEHKYHRLPLRNEPKIVWR